MAYGAPGPAQGLEQRYKDIVFTGFSFFTFDTRCAGVRYSFDLF